MRKVVLLLLSGLLTCATVNAQTLYATFSNYAAGGNVNPVVVNSGNNDQVTLSHVSSSAYSVSASYACMDNKAGWQVASSRTAWIEFGLSLPATTKSLETIEMKVTKNTDNTSDFKAVVLFSASYPFDEAQPVLEYSPGQYYALVQMSNRNTGTGVNACGINTLIAPPGAKSARIYRQVYLHNTSHLIVSSTTGASTLGSAQTAYLVELMLYSAAVSGTPPTVTSTAASSITTTTASSGGNVTAEGTASVTAKGVVWNTSAAPTVALTTKTNDGTGAGVFTSAITSLTANTKYFYRAYATSTVGTSYGSENSFTTLPAAPVSAAASSVTLTSFTANWAPGTQGSETFTYTLEYSTDNTFASGVTSVPLIASTTTSQNLSPLTSGATYYYRVQAVNAQGVSAYSATQSITLAASTATYHYRSAATGTWSAGATWEASADGTTGWAAPAAGPDDQASSITIRNGHIVTAAANVSADDLTIETGGRLNISNGITFTVANGTAATDLIINGYLQNSGTVTATGTISGNGATAVYEQNANSINVPAITWTSGSTLKLTGSYTGAGVSPTGRLTAGAYQNIIYEGQVAAASDYVSFGDNVITIAGKLTMSGTGLGSVLTSAGGTSPAVAEYEQTSGIVFINRNSGSTRSLTVTGNATISGGTLHIKTLAGAGAGEFNIGGNLSVTGTGLITNSATAGATMMRFNGSVTQAINPGSPTGTINYTINNAAGISLGSDLTANGTLTFTAGNISTGANKVIVSATGSIVNGGTNGWVAGNLQKNVATGATSKTFEVGDATGYRPVTVAFGNVGTAGDLTASVSQTAGDHPNIGSSGLDAVKTVNRFWTLTNNGILFDQYDATFTFLAGDVDAGANTAAFVVKKYNGSSWSAATTGVLTATSSQATALTSFSDFVIGETAAVAGPVVTTQPNSTAVCAGSNAAFTSASTSLPAPSVQWERSTNGSSWVAIDGTIDGGVYSNFTTGTLNITGATTGINNYQYRAVFTNVNGTGTSNAATLAVNAIPAVTNANTASICSGTALNIPLTATTPGATFAWTIGTNASGVTGASAASGNTISQTLTNPGNSAAATIEYIVTPTSNSSPACPGAPYTITVTVNPKPVVTTANAFTICSGQSTNIALTASAASTFSWTNGAITGGITGATPSVGSAITQTLTNPSSTTPGSVEYIVTPTASGCAGNAYSIIVTVNAATNALAGTTGGAPVCNSHDVGTSSNFLNNCEFIATVTPSGGTPVTGIVNACVKVDAAVSGSPLYVQRTFTVTATAATTATVTLYFLQSEFNAFNAANGTFGDLPTGSSDVTGKANLRISVFPAAAHTPGGAGETLYDPSDANIIFNATANRWEVSIPVTLAANNSFFVHTNHFPLPVTLIDFKGEFNGASNRLAWSTATENNNGGFEIERSADGQKFSSIAFVKSKAENGNSTSVLNYEMNDTRPFAGNSYYRLKQVDRNGKFAYSKTVLLGRKVTELSITNVYPNPSVSELNVVINSPKQEKIRLVVTDLSGKTVMERTTVVVAGMNQQVVSVAQLSAGTYLVKVTCENGCETAVQRFVKQ